MISEQIFSNDDGNELALSCVERQLIYILSNKEVDISPLFYKSYVSANRIIYEFLCNDMKYASFNVIQRVQDVASELGVILYEYKKGADKKFMDSYDYILVQVTAEFTQKKYGKNIWRDDHFVLLTKKSQYEYYYLNDNPYDQLIISNDHFREMYAGNMIGISLVDEGEILGCGMLDKFYALVVEEEITQVKVVLKENIDYLIQLRNALGILKVIRKRNIRFLSNFFNMDFAKDYIQYLDSLYVKLEYNRLRKKETKIEDIIKIIEMLIDKDTYFKNEMKRSIKEFLCV